MKHRMALCVLAVLIGSPARAQDGSEGSAQRTVESAQQFLSEMHDQYSGYFRYSLGVHAQTARDRRGRWIPVRDPGYRLEYEATWAIDRIEHPERCVTRFHLRPGSLVVTQGVAEAEMPVEPLSSVDVHWSSLEEAYTHAGANDLNPATGVRLFISPARRVAGSPWIGLVYGTTESELWGRLAFATRFLREACRFQSRTGF